MHDLRRRAIVALLMNGPVHELSEPQFEIDQCQQVIGVVPFLGVVFLNQLLDDRPSKQPSRSHLSFGQGFLNEHLQISAQPRPHGRSEAALLAVQNFSRQPRLNRLLEYIFHSEAMDFKMSGHSRRELDQLVIHKRSSTFQGHRHRHFVREGQEIVRNRRFQVDINKAVEIFSPDTLLEITLHQLRGRFHTMPVVALQLRARVR